MSVRQEILIDEKPNNSHRQKTQFLKLQTHSVHAVWTLNVKPMDERRASRQARWLQNGLPQDTQNKKLSVCIVSRKWWWWFWAKGRSLSSGKGKASIVALEKISSNSARECRRTPRASSLDRSVCAYNGSAPVLGALALCSKHKLSSSY